MLRRAAALHGSRRESRRRRAADLREAPRESRADHFDPSAFQNKSFVLATLAADTTLFVPGFVIYGVLLASFFDKEAMRAEPAMGPLVLGHIFLGAFVALILCLTAHTLA